MLDHDPITDVSFEELIPHVPGRAARAAKAIINETFVGPFGIFHKEDAFKELVRIKTEADSLRISVENLDPVNRRIAVNSQRFEQEKFIALFEALCTYGGYTPETLSDELSELLKK